MIGVENLFKMGIKKALLAGDTEENYTLFANDFPYVEMSYDAPNKSRKVYLRCFFHNEEQKNKFEKEAVKETNEMQKLPFDEKIMGEYLGFPSLAISDFTTGLTKENRVYVNYHGLHFVVSDQNAKKALEELKTTMPIPFFKKMKYRSKIILEMMNENGQYVEVELI